MDETTQVENKVKTEVVLGKYTVEKTTPNTVRYWTKLPSGRTDRQYIQKESLPKPFPQTIELVARW